MEKHDARFLVRHVLMDGDDVDLLLEQRSQDRLQFIFRYCEISINNGVVIAAVTSSSNKTVSPMTMTPLLVSVNAAQVPRPMNGGIVHPSTTTFMSSRGNVTR